MESAALLLVGVGLAPTFSARAAAAWQLVAERESEDRLATTGKEREKEGEVRLTGTEINVPLAEPVQSKMYRYSASQNKSCQQPVRYKEKLSERERKVAVAEAAYSREPWLEVWNELT